MKVLFKIWDCRRAKKIFVPMEDEESGLYEQLILKASEKLQIHGTRFVLESDGTSVDDDEVLKIVSTQTLILLTKTEAWEALLATTATTSIVASINEEKESASDSFSSTSEDLVVAKTTQEIANSQISKHMWNTLEIPWHRLSKEVLGNCEKGIRQKSSLDSVAQVIIDAAREISLHVPTYALKRVAEKVIAKYPGMFKDVDDDEVVIGDGTHTLYKKLCDHCRPFKRSRSVVGNEAVSPQQIKRQINRTSGCQNCDPEISEEGLDLLMDKKALVNNMYLEFNAETRKLLDETYSLQRYFINKPSTTVEDIRKEWPILFIKEAICWHYNKLMNQDIGQLETVFLSKLDKFMQFALKKKYITAPPEHESDKIKISLIAISKFLGDDLAILLMDASEGQDQEQTLTTMAPCIRCLKESKEYIIYLEKREIMRVDNLLEALQVTFALYYNFNLIYTQGCAATLEFIQRYFMKIHPDRGSRNKNKRCGKLLSLINQLADKHLIC
ncbi:hypothetical protein MML48_6g00001703 [Holotrichia oblita]|uniref:Uncharacterized protein n=1 Tax=Holotrichia oblita TaxID=644536 RepID=A0ACB9SXE3_HOLOL|nr:hypothetical protein MML48_6g00001703 [Holotrichia oblita]